MLQMLTAFYKCTFVECANLANASLCLKSRVSPPDFLHSDKNMLLYYNDDKKCIVTFILRVFVCKSRVGICHFI